MRTRITIGMVVITLAIMSTKVSAQLINQHIGNQNIGASFFETDGLGAGFGFGQRSTRSNVSTSASLTTMDGMPGYIFSQTVRPFVTGVYPVVGNGSVVGFPYQSVMPPLPPSPDEAFRGYQQAQIAQWQQRRARQYESVQKKAAAAFQRGLRAEQDGNLRMARANYRNALQTATGSLRLEILQRTQARGW